MMFIEVNGPGGSFWINATEIRLISRPFDHGVPVLGKTLLHITGMPGQIAIDEDPDKFRMRLEDTTQKPAVEKVIH